jgi:hypothetical protein
MPGPGQLDRLRAGQQRGQPGRDQPEVRQVPGPRHDQAGRVDRAQVNGNLGGPVITTSPEGRLCARMDVRRPMSFGCCAGLPSGIT